MPGYDKNRFINLMDEDELMCGICHGIFIKPKITPCCRQTYCTDCIEQWLQENSSCPNDRQQLYANNLFPAPRLLYNMLNKLLMNCEYRENGCTENFILENIEGHMKVCAYNPNSICIDCNHLIGNKSSHNCINNMKTDNKKLIEGKKKVEHKFHLSRVTLNSVNEKCEQYLKELNNLKEKNSQNEKQIKAITEENKTLHINESELLLENKKLKELSSKLYNNLKSIERDMGRLKTNNDSDLNIVIKTLENYADKQLSSDTQKINIIDKLSKFTLYIENDNLFKELYNTTKDNNASDVDLINFQFRIMHRYVQCNECNVNPIVGIRYKCNECKDYDLCETCIQIKEIIHSSSHTFREICHVAMINNKIAASRFKIEGLSILNSTMKSPPTIVRNLPWKIKAKPYTEGTYAKKTITALGLYVECNGESDSKTWFCNASVDLSIISQKEGIENFSRKFKHKFCNQVNDMGYHKFIGWKDILDPVKGFIKDDAIILEVLIFADES